MTSVPHFVGNVVVEASLDANCRTAAAWLVVGAVGGRHAACALEHEVVGVAVAGEVVGKIAGEPEEVVKACKAAELAFEAEQDPEGHMAEEAEHK